MLLRYTLPEQIAAEREFVPSGAWWNFAPKFNVAAAQYVPAIRWHAKQSEGVMLRWGLIPSWAEGKAQSNPAACVESDRIARSKFYGGPWLEGQRCILPMAGFYVWQLTGERYRQPHYVRLIDRTVFGVAGIWDRSVLDEEDVIESCAIICVPANPLIREIANTKPLMPAILKRKDYATWLKGTPVQAKAALHSYRADWMQAHRVSPRVNSADVDDRSLIQAAQ